MEYNSLNVKWSSSQFDKLKLATRNASAVTLRLSLNMAMTNKSDFPHNLLSADGQDKSFLKAFENNSSANTKSPETQLLKITESGKLPASILGPLIKVASPLRNQVKVFDTSSSFNLLWNLKILSKWWI